QHLIVAIFLFMAYTAAFSQEPEPAKSGGIDKSKLFIGGNFGLNFGTFTLVNLSPQLGYRFNDYFAAGAGVNFIYSSIRDEFSDGSTTRFNQGVTGFNIFGRVYPIQQILLQVQPELNYTWGKYRERGFNYDNTFKLESKFIPSLLLGGGAALPAGSGAFVIMAQYDVLQQERNPYGDKIFFSFGYNIGF
ncbi:MAG: hypothetical protein H7Y03_05655, partial [Chitinophagaceae bacterium]|nr:hypothetical protein [Chitinophagaceae bacterium]